jgi:hypothetical protein|tara:strand:+ start:3624 stop:4169 length:546 start_codon:yes stop_codon:yes gene_type:complete
MLTNKELQRIEILSWRKAKAATIADTAAHFGLSDAGVYNAIQWGRKSGFFTEQTVDNLEKHIAEYSKAIKEIEKELRIARRAARRKYLKPDGTEGVRRVPLPANIINAIFGRWNEYRTRLMELEGIYRQVVNHHFSGEIGVRKKTDLAKLSISELTTLETLTAKARNGHGSNGGNGEHGDN